MHITRKEQDMNRDNAEEITKAIEEFIDAKMREFRELNTPNDGTGGFYTTHAERDVLVDCLEASTPNFKDT